MFVLRLATIRRYRQPRSVARYGKGRKGVAMNSFEWMELQTLTSEIAASRSRLVAARSGKDHRLARVLVGGITAAVQQRAQLLADLTTDLSGSPGEPVRPTSSEDAELQSVEETLPDSPPALARAPP